MPGYYDWLNARRGMGVAVCDGSLDLTKHDKARHGGKFDPSTMKCKLRDDIKKVDNGDVVNANEVQKALVKIDDEEYKELESGDNPNTTKFGDVEIGDLATFGKTSSKYRNLRNSVFNEITKRMENGEEGLDGSYSFGPPPHKVQHVGEDGELHDGYADGFQVSFQTTNGEGFNRDREDLLMSDSEYDKTVEELSKETGSEPVVGIFGGIPEISFRCETRKQALDIAKRFNQVSICVNKRVAHFDFSKRAFPKNKMYDWTRNQVHKANS